MSELTVEQKKPKKKIWQHPWKYKESFIISVCLVLTGFLIQYFSRGQAVRMPSWPGNIFIIIVFIVYVILFHRFVNHPVKRWFSSVPAAVAAISTLTFIILLMGFIPQKEDAGGTFTARIGLTHIVGSWAYLLCSFNLLFVLSFTIMRRIWPFSIKNFAFALNHLGLWLVLVAASLGATDAQKLKMGLEEGKVSFTAYDNENQPQNMGFAIRLKDFQIEEYTPDLGIFDTATHELINKRDRLIEAKTGAGGKFGTWNIKIEKYIANAHHGPAGYDPGKMEGSVPAALINVQDEATNEKQKGWVSSEESLYLGGREFIAMTVQPKKYRSIVDVYYSSGNSENDTIEVNKPLKVNGWKIYQASYDTKMGKWSTVSYLEIVKDPWLPAVYTGIFMIMAGALYLFWMGRKR